MFEDRGGMFTLIGGLVTLVVVATGLALVMEKRDASSKVKTEAEKTMGEDQQMLEIVKDDLSRANERLVEMSGRTAIDEKYQQVKAAVEKRSGPLADLRARQAVIKDSLGKLEQDFTKYQQAYVTAVRTAAESEEIASLRLKSGKEYSKVTISRVTPEGLEIRHEFGTARVGAHDLDDKWNERFLWR